MHLLVLIVLGTLATIGALTLVAVYSVIRFGDDSLRELSEW